eukprot:Sdes_comp19574_c0_seq1m11266
MALWSIIPIQWVKFVNKNHLSFRIWSLEYADFIFAMILGRTALHWSALTGNSLSLKLLLKEGSDPNYPDHQGKMPLHLALFSKDTSCAMILLEASCIVDAFDLEKMTPLMVATFRNCLDHVKLFLKYGASVNLCDQTGKGLIHLATISNQRETLEYLVENHKNLLDQQETQGKTALHL